MIRPLQPLLFRQVLLCAWLVGIAVFWRPEALVVLPLVLLVVILMDKRCRHGGRLAVLVLCALLGWSYTAWREGLLQGGQETRPFEKGVVSGTVQDVRGLYDRRLQITLDGVTVHGEAVAGRAVWQWEGGEEIGAGNEARQQRPRVLPGQHVTLTSTLRPMGGFRNAEGEDSADHWRRKGVFWRLWTPADARVTVTGAGDTLPRWREALRGTLIARLNNLYPDTAPRVRYGQEASSAPHGWGFIPALLFGDRYYLGAEDTRLLQEAGLAHSIALSGQHLAVAGLAAAALLWLAGIWRPELFLRLPRFVMGLCLSVPLAVVYLWLGDAPPSLLRAAIMLFCWTLFCAGRRPAAFTDSIFFALLALTVLDPASLTDVGVLLSFSAVGGLALASPVFQRWWQFAKNRPWLSMTGSLLLSSLAVQLATLPVALSTFGWLSSWFWLNLLWLPVLGAWVLPLAALGLVFSWLPAVGDVLLFAAVEPCHWLVESLRLVDIHMGMAPLWCLRPHGLAIAGFVCLLLGAAVTQARKQLPTAAKVLCVAGLGLLFAAPLVRLADGLNPTIRLRLLDVGQGQAALVEFPFEQRVLVDAGGFRSTRFDSGKGLVAPVLTANRPPRLTALAMSHADQDHARGLLFFARHFGVGEVLMPAGEGGHDQPLAQALEGLAVAREIPVRWLTAGDTRGYGSAGLEVLAPLPGRKQAQNDGLVLRLTVNRNGETIGLAILPGDATKNLLRGIRGSGQKMRAHVLVAPHHGSRQNINPDFIRAVHPSLVLASCGQYNRYDFPSEKLQDLCTEMGIPLRDTGTEGEIVTTWPLY